MSSNLAIKGFVDLQYGTFRYFEECIKLILKAFNVDTYRLVYSLSGTIEKNLKYISKQVFPLSKTSIFCIHI